MVHNVCGKDYSKPSNQFSIVMQNRILLFTKISIFNQPIRLLLLRQKCWVILASTSDSLSFFMTSQLRNFIFTWNNPPNNHEALLREHEDIKFLVYQLETGVNGTKHLQGYIELRKRLRFGVLRKWHPWHIEKRMGSQKQAIDYCRKEDTRTDGPWEFGARSEQGARTDIAEAYERIRKGESKLEIADNLPATDAKYHKALDRYRTLFQEESSRTFRHLHVSVLWGDAGTGKTRKAVEASSDYYILNQPGGQQLWWDGYEGQDTLIIDDFSGWIKYRLLLKILDGYQLRLSIKGGFTYARWTKVILTSNKSPTEWYQHKGMTPELKRRIHSTTHFDQNWSARTPGVVPRPDAQMDDV